MISLDLQMAKLVVLAAGSILIVGAALFALRTGKQRTIFLMWFGGFLIYSGVATADQSVPLYLMGAYFVFAASALVGLLVGKPLVHRIGSKVSASISYFLDGISQKSFARNIILIYFLVKLAYLIYPEFKLNQLLSPPAPDIREWFNSRLRGDSKSALEGLLDYLDVILVPFFYFALYSLRKNMLVLGAVLAGVLYLEYISDGYLGRYRAGFAVLFLFMCAWWQKPQRRIWLGVGAMLLVPLLAYLMHAYTFIRQGASYSSVGLTEAMLLVFESEARFLLTTGLVVIESRYTATLPDYFLWIITLPIPGVLKSGLNLTHVNHEVSAIILGRYPGDPGFYVLLPGLLAESYYIFGRHLFWLHGVFVGLLMAFFCKMLERAEALTFLFFYICLMFCLVLNRGGISSLLPPVVNGFVVFGIMVGLVVLSRRRLRQRRSP